MRFKKLLRESLHVLKDEPRVFIPRIITTLIYSVFIFTAAKVSYSLSIALAVESTKATPDLLSAIMPFTAQLKLLALYSLISFITDMCAYAMYPTLVSDYQRKTPVSLKRAVKNALKVWRTLLAFSTTILILLASILFSFSLLYSHAIMKGNMPLLIFGALSLMLMMVGVSSLIFFIIPIAVIEQKGIIYSYKKSMELGLHHKKPVIKTTLLFMVIAYATMILAAASEFEGKKAAIAFTLFIIARLIQVVTYTYINVVNPSLYFSLRKEDENT